MTLGRTAEKYRPYPKFQEAIAAYQLAAEIYLLTLRDIFANLKLPNAAAVVSQTSGRTGGLKWRTAQGG